MMNMSVWAIRNPIPPIAFFLVLCIVGLVSFSRLPITQFPNIDIPIITVNIGQPGAAPSEIVTQILEPVESAVADIPGVKHVRSTATDSSASLVIEFALETNTEEALTDVKDAVASVRSDLPDAATDPIIDKLDVVGLPILTYAVSDPTQSAEQLSYFVDDVVARQLQVAGGVGSVKRMGGTTRAIEVELDNDRLLAFGLTVSDVNNQILQNNVNIGAGSGELAGQDYSLRAMGGVTTIEELAAMPISLKSGAIIRLDDVATVTDGAKDVTSFAYYDQKPVIAFGVFRAPGSSDLTASQNTRAKLEDIAEQYPNVEFSLIDDTTVVYTLGTYHSAMETLFEGAALAILVVFLFLRNWRATIITGIALPLSIIPTFFVMQMLGFSLNVVSLLGITLVTGILVDDAIVEIENIVRHIQMGEPAYEASEEAATEIGRTVIAISFTIVAVFAPVSFMSGIAGQYFKQFGLTVAVAVIFSLLVARLITPMMSAYFLKDGTAPEEEKDGYFMSRYMQVLHWTLANRVKTLAIGLVVFALSIFSATLLPTEFIPPTDAGTINVSIEMPPGSTVDESKEKSLEVANLLKTIGEVQHIFIDGRSVSVPNVSVNIGTKKERERTSFEITDQIKAMVATVPDVKIVVLNENGDRDIIMNVLGDTEESVALAADVVAKEMNALPEVQNASSSASLVRPEIKITPRTDIATELGVNSITLGTTLRVATMGESGSNVANFNAGDRQIPIMVRLSEDVRDDLFKMADIRIPTNTGKTVPLDAVASLSLSTGASSIERYDRKFLTSVKADIANGYILGQATGAVAGMSMEGKMPEGTEIQSGGDAEVMADIFTQFGLAMGAGILLVYVVLVLLFSSFLTPITILASLPLAIGGAIFALYLYGAGIGLSVIIGFLMLMGIVTKNAIMLVEFATETMKKGVSKHDAILDAGHKRARPIVMTTIAMTAGMVPSAIGSSIGGEFRAPMAVGVIGGLLLSTFLTLLFIPSVFSVVDGLKRRASRWLHYGLGANRPLEPEES